ncbi:MAG: NADH-quinone oxidoreductase subunit NuoE [Gordonia sp. (in: high G+C Gram-positive bacteria)]|nr:MAG: NADH-quinone oxidoreductase subunit NuoE [Gordonia sp. (in: high G+C Gram-positive bacteria)]
MTAEPVFLTFGDPVPPAQRYPADVVARLEPDAREIIARYPDARSALLPLLHLVQSEDGYITPAGIAFCGGLLELTPAEVTAVSTFYSMYRRRPTGDFLVGVCTNTLCAVMGGDEILADLIDHLGVAPGGTTADGSITLEHLECNAACDFAPVVMVNWEFFDNQTPESGRELVDALRSGEQVTPTRGAPPCTFRETARILAGFPDLRPGSSEAAGSAGDASLAGLRIARDRGMEAPASDHSGVPDKGATDVDRTDEADEAKATQTAADKPAPAPNAQSDNDTATTDSKEV